MPVYAAIYLLATYTMSLYIMSVQHLASVCCLPESAPPAAVAVVHGLMLQSICLQTHKTTLVITSCLD